MVLGDLGNRQSLETPRIETATFSPWTTSSIASPVAFREICSEKSISFSMARSGVNTSSFMIFSFG